jgi:FlaA1/EpsC-like NDP-sugar epimerase
MLGFIVRLPRRAKQAMILILDVLLVPVAITAAFALQANDIGLEALARHWKAFPLLMMIAALLTIVMGIHKVQLKAYENRAIGMTAIHAVLMGLSTAVLDDLAGYGTPLSTFVNFALVYFLLAVTIRVVALQVVLAIYRQGQDQVRVLIYGAGRTGQQLAAALKTDQMILPVAYIDDNKALQSTIVQGLYVYSPIAIASLVAEKQVDRVLLAMPSVTRPRLAQISRRLEDMGLDVQTLPSFAQLAGSGADLIEQLTPVVADRFLGRAPLDAELPGGSETYAGKSILITGAGGSIGSELCRQLLTCAPKRLVMMEISELQLYTIDLELKALAARTGVELVAACGGL